MAEVFWATPTDVPLPKHTHTHPHTPSRTHTHPHSHTLTHTHEYFHARHQGQVGTYREWSCRVCVCVCVCACVRVGIYAHTHTHTHFFRTLFHASITITLITNSAIPIYCLSTYYFNIPIIHTHPKYILDISIVLINRYIFIYFQQNHNLLQ